MSLKLNKPPEFYVGDIISFNGQIGKIILKEENIPVSVDIPEWPKHDLHVTVYTVKIGDLEYRVTARSLSVIKTKQQLYEELLR